MSWIFFINFGRQLEGYPMAIHPRARRKMLNYSWIISTFFGSLLWRLVVGWIIFRVVSWSRGLLRSHISGWDFTTSQVRLELEVKKANKTHFQEMWSGWIGPVTLVWKVKVTVDVVGWVPENLFWAEIEFSDIFCGTWGPCRMEETLLCAPISKKTSFHVGPASLYLTTMATMTAGNVTRRQPGRNPCWPDTRDN